MSTRSQFSLRMPQICSSVRSFRARPSAIILMASGSITLKLPGTDLRRALSVGFNRKYSSASVRQNIARAANRRRLNQLARDGLLPFAREEGLAILECLHFTDEHKRLFGQGESHQRLDTHIPAWAVEPEHSVGL